MGAIDRLVYGAAFNAASWLSVTIKPCLDSLAEHKAA
jgi:hypothetical protein